MINLLLQNNINLIPLEIKHVRLRNGHFCHILSLRATS